MTIAVGILYALVLIADFLPFVKKGRKKENIVYIAFLTASFAVLILYTLDIKAPGPTDLIINAIRAVFGT